MHANGVKAGQAATDSTAVRSCSSLCQAEGRSESSSATSWLAEGAHNALSERTDLTRLTAGDDRRADRCDAAEGGAGHSGDNQGRAAAGQMAAHVHSCELCLLCARLTLLARSPVLSPCSKFAKRSSSRPRRSWLPRISKRHRLSVDCLSYHGISIPSSCVGLRFEQKV